MVAKPLLGFCRAVWVKSWSTNVLWYQSPTERWVNPTRLLRRSPSLPFRTGPNMSHASRDVHSARELVDLLSEPTGRLSGANIPELSSRSSTREIVGELAAELNVPWECSQVCHSLAQNAKAAAPCNSADTCAV